MIIQDNKTKIIDPNELEELSLLAGKTIGELTYNKFPGLLVFPRDILSCEDLGQETTIYEIHIKDGKHYLTTNNIVGFIGFQNSQLTIRSRFAEEKEEDYFLHYMLQKVLSINIIDLKHKTSEEQILDLLIYLFPLLLKRAIRQGVFKEYQNREYDNAKIKGQINVSKFIQKDIPFAGHIAFKTREFCADNKMNQLIRHTIEYIKTKKLCNGIQLLNIDEETKRAVDLIVSNTPSYQFLNRRNIVNKNIKAIQHPYYSAYIPLQRLCLQILRHQGLKYGQNNETIQGVLFDAAWLWEEYINTILKPMNFEHPQKKKNQGAIYLFEGNKGRRYPDFYKKDIILDAKYKQAANRDDFHQMISYQYILKGKIGAFISPNLSFECKHIGKLNGYGANIFTYHLGIPLHLVRFSDFCEEMRKQEELFRASLKKSL